MKSDQIFHYDQAFALEAGGILPGFQLKYTTLGQLNQERSNVVWVIHALTGNSDVTTWWPDLFENDGPYNPKDYFVICANTLGGCYGSTGPLSLNPQTGKPFYHDFPMITNRDIVRAFDLLRKELRLERVHTVTGSSLGGQQALEWSIQEPDVFEHLVLIASNARHSAWGIAFNEAQRMAIEADPSWKESDHRAGTEGLKAARAIAMLSYRSYAGFAERQTEKSIDRLDNFRAGSYLRHQGKKLADRFNAYTYWILSMAMDNHHAGRGRISLEAALSTIKARTLVIGIEGDILFPISEQQFLSGAIRSASLEVIHSIYGHDGFLVEFDQLKSFVNKFYQRSKSTVTV